MDFCHLKEIFPTDIENNYWILPQKQDSMLLKLQPESSS